MRRSLISLLMLAALGLLPAASLAGEAKPEESTEAAAGPKGEDAAARIRPVSGNLFLKQSRLELSPTLGLSLGDAFFQKYAFGAKLSYHLSELFSFGLHGSYQLASPSSAVSVCDKNGCRNPEIGELNDVPGRVQWMAGLELAISPFYGKVNVLSEKVVHFDTSLILGGTLLSYGIPGGSTATAIAGTFGIGQRYVLGRNLALRAELRDYLYSAQTVTLGDANSKIENQLMLELGLSYFVGEPPQQ